jgi:hypothetical protein
MEKKVVQSALRLEEAFHAELKAQAKLNRRSLHAHLLFLLEASSQFLKEKQKLAV